MGGIFSTPKTQKPPPLPEEEVLPLDQETEEPAKKRRHRGRSETILTGDFAPATGNKKVLLGGA